MNKKLLSLALLGLLFISPPVNSTGQIDFGGKLDDGDLSIITSVDYTWSAGKFERDIEFDYRYKDEDEIRSTSKGLIEFKQRYEFHDKHYSFGLARYDYDEFRPMNSRLQSSVGWGYKILRTEKFKMSNEFATGILYSDMGNELIFRNSLWFFYEVAPKINFSNKFLYEAADEPLIRNETSFDYLLTDKVKIGIKNIYTEDPRNDNILSFNLGYSW